MREPWHASRQQKLYLRMYTNADPGLEPGACRLAYAIVKQNFPEDGRLATGAWRWHEYVEKNKTLEDAMRSAVHALKEASHVLHFNATAEYGIGLDGSLERCAPRRPRFSRISVVVQDSLYFLSIMDAMCSSP